MDLKYYLRLSPLKQREEFERLTLGFSERAYKSRLATQKKKQAKTIADKKAA